MSRFNLRNKPRISYYEPDEPNLDEYVFCSDCGDFVYEYCSIHGPLLVVPDDKPPTKSPFPPCVPRAALTIPHVFLHIAPSKIPGAGLGVFTTLALPSGVRFGPYVGKKTEQITSMYCWQIHDYNNKRTYVIDAEDPNKSNWMRYVNCSRHWCEQNLIAYQYRGRIYYRTIKIIPRYTELMVFYGSEFAHMLHINLKNYNAPTGYAQKFGGPNFLSIQRKHDEIPLKTECVKEKSTKLSLDAESNSKLANIQENKRNDVSEIHLEKSQQPTNKKVKFNAPKKTQTDKNKSINERSKKIKNKIFNSKNIKSIDKNKNTEKNLQSEEKNNCTKSCDFDNNENVKTECFKQISKKYNKKLKTSVTKENKSIKESHLEKNKDIKKSPEYKNNSFQPKSYVQNIFSCDICNFKTTLKKRLGTHLLTHGVETKYTCSHCDYITKYKACLNVHMRTHTGEKPYSCDVCDKKFNQKISLNIHIRSHTGEKPYSCVVCDKKFNQKINLNNHIRTHTGEKPYSCNVCNKNFSRQSNLNIHSRTHTGEKPYSCDVCDKKFNQKISLNIHIRTHTGEKPYSCNVCNKNFSRQSNLNIHSRTHTGEKHYSCNVCNKNFSQQSSLNIHSRTHTGEKPYSCNFCNKKFNQQSNLNQHIRTHTREKTNSCNKKQISRSVHIII